MKEYIEGEKSLSEMTDEELKEFSQMAKDLVHEGKKAEDKIIERNELKFFTPEDMLARKHLNKLKDMWWKNK